MFDTIAPLELVGFNRVALSNRWLFGPLLDRQLAQSPSTNALMRTTTALTIRERRQQGQRPARPAPRRS